MEQNNKKGILMVMSNANGWRNPSVFGGAEIKSTSIMDKLSNFDWYIILPVSLNDVFRSTYFSSHLYYLPIKTMFSTTNVFKDLIQGLFYTWNAVAIGWKHKKNYQLIYSATTNFSDIFPAKIISWITGKSFIVKYHISIYDEPKVFRIYQNFREEKNSVSDSLIRAVLARLSIRFLKQAKSTLVTCRYLKEQLIRCGVNSQKILVNYNGLDFSKMGECKDDTLTKIFDLCSIGRIEKNKGMQDLVDVVKKLKEVKPDVSAVIIGDGSYLNELKAYIRDNDLEKNILITGFLGDERYKLLQQSCIFVSPTYAKEGFGLTLLEALFFNVPLIAYTHPVLEEVFGHFYSVVLIDQDKEILFEKCASILKESKKFVPADLESYSLDNCVSRENEILSRLV